MDLDQALAAFDATETTLRRLEAVWDRLSTLVPEGIALLGDSLEGVEYEDLGRAFRELVAGLPRIDGYQIEEFPLGVDEIAQNRLDARDVGFFDAIVAVEQGVAAPGEAIREFGSASIASGASSYASAWNSSLERSTHTSRL